MKYYAMSMPEQYPNGGVVSPIEVTPDADGNIELGNSGEFIFRPYYMGKDQWTDYYGLCIGGGSYKHGGVVLTYGSGKIFYYDRYDYASKVRVRFRYDYEREYNRLQPRLWRNARIRLYRSGRVLLHRNAICQ